MAMSRPYISGPMTDYEHHNLPAFFYAEDKLRMAGFHPINPARSNGTTWQDAYQYGVDNPKTWEEYIRADVKLLLDSDGIVLLPGWELSKGACIELVLSVIMGHVVAEYSEPDDYAFLNLKTVDVEDVYRKALDYLAKCGLGGVNLDADGYARYASR